MSDLRAIPPLGRRAVAIAWRRQIGPYAILGVHDGGGPPPRAGQFYMLAAERGWGAGEDERPYLPRALSVMRAGGDDRCVELQFMIDVVGPGTQRLCELEEGESLLLTGPLGTGFDVPEGGRALLCGGGVGVAPLAILQDELLVRGTEVRALVGFRDAEHALGAEVLADALVATDDGSVGHHGRVTDLLRAELDADGEAASVYACGPPAMLEAVRQLCGELEVPCQLALEAPMACGFGACFGCVVPAADGSYVRVCVDGPVFDGHALAEVPHW